MLKAVSRIDDESREEYVQFTPVEQSYEDKKSGLYCVKVKIVKYADDIKICPNGTLIPKIKDIYPPYNPAGYNQDTVIKVTFNKSVNPESFGDFSCITFSSANADISSCYGTPYFSSDNTVLFIPPVPGKKIIDDQSQNNTAEVTLKINCTNLTDEDGLSVSKFEPYTYCVNKTVDSIAPTITSFEMTTTGDTNAWYYRTLTDDAFEDWSAAQVNESDGTVKYYYGDFSRNHVGKSVHIKLQGYDNADAISGVLIREVFEKDVAGNNAGENELTQFIDDFEILTDENGVAVLSEDGNKIYSFDFDYVLQSKGDGLVLLEVYLKDGANKDDHRNYEVIKQSETNKSIQFDLELDTTGVLPQLVDGKYKSHIRVPVESGSHCFNIYADEKIYEDYLGTTSKFVLYFYDENDSAQNVFELDNFVSFKSKNYNVEDEFNVALADVLVDSYRDTKAKAVYYEANGLTKEFEFVIPSAPHGISLTGSDEYNASVETTFGPLDYLRNAYILYKNQETGATRTWTGNEVTQTVIANINSTTNSDTYPFGLYEVYTKRTVKVLTSNGYISYIRSSYGEPVIHKKDGSSPQSFSLNWSVKNISYEPSSSMATVEINVSYPDDGKTYYFMVEGDSSDNYKSYYSKANSNIVIIPNGKLYTNVTILRMNPSTGFDGYAYTDNKAIDCRQYDNFPPDMSFHQSYWDTSYFYIYNVNITDKKEGLANNTSHGITNFDCYYSKTDLGDNPSVETAEQKSVLKKTITFETDPDNSSKKCAKIPFSDIEQGEYYLYAYLKDNKGNGKLKLLSQQTINYAVHGVYFSLRDATPQVVRNADKKLEVKIPQGYSGKINRYMLEQKNGKWVWTDWDGGCYEYNSSNTYDYDGYNGDPGTKNHFMMVTAREYTGSWGTYHLKPLYYYPNYKNGEITCLSTSWLKVDNGYQIFCDAPAFCHTLYSTRKITAGNSEEDALEWEAQAQETGIVVSENGSGFTYKNTNLDGVPSGCWYTTICHFADGTVLMSPVEQMHR